MENKERSLNNQLLELMKETLSKVMVYEMKGEKYKANEEMKKIAILLAQAKRIGDKESERIINASLDAYMFVSSLDEKK